MILGHSWEEKGKPRGELEAGEGGEEFADVTDQCLGLQEPSTFLSRFPTK